MLTRSLTGFSPVPAASADHPSEPRPARPGPFRQVLADAWRCWRTRRLIADLDDRLLKDIGATRSDARAEAAKPFWRP